MSAKEMFEALDYELIFINDTNVKYENYIGEMILINKDFVSKCVQVSNVVRLGNDNYTCNKLEYKLLTMKEFKAVKQLINEKGWE